MVTGGAFYHRGMLCRIVEVESDRRLWIRFPGEDGGSHGFDLLPVPGGTLVNHTLVQQQHGKQRVLWLLVIRSMHSAVMEGLLDNLELAGTGSHARRPRRFPYARLLRRLLAARAAA